MDRVEIFDELKTVRCQGISPVYRFRDLQVAPGARELAGVERRFQA